ncbi:hypothetical protein BDB00DRAFT_608984 [Zychaea mexicana]|uniref:uncharacterized protein n=1 Tax=Zychaea mexicana TaxID=64656 RepID=UPI0022FF214B|nr:uncharacterized protein BDB00DRAFT_608984 [Zychaea mexicana]KAI9489565.1 hypothetical protein BDB00DRAFT_608984 [Zychaea mexicana]
MNTLHRPSQSSCSFLYDDEQQQQGQREKDEFNNLNGATTASANTTVNTAAYATRTIDYVSSASFHQNTMLLEETSPTSLPTSNSSPNSFTMPSPLPPCGATGLSDEIGCGEGSDYHQYLVASEQLLPKQDAFVEQEQQHPFSLSASHQISYPTAGM